jgi:hypothetical protein
MSDTPETDALWDWSTCWEKAWLRVAENMRDKARLLERQRDEARELADSYRIAFCSANGMDKMPTPFPWEDSK